MTSIQNNSNILAKEASGIFEQIRKKAEDISTSEGSYGFFYNLSNPTNLTNPQIVAVRTVDSNLYNSDAKQNNILYKIKAKNKSRQYKYDITSTQSNRTELIERLLINKQIQKSNKNKKKKLIFDKNSESQKIYNYAYKKQLEDQFRKNTTIMPIGEEDNNLWNKLKKENNNIKEKYRRINRRRYITSREYIDSTKNIQLLRFIRKNKIEKLNNLISIKNSEIDTLNSNIESLENNKESIIINYNKRYVSYINFLIRQKDIEEKNVIDLIIKSGRIRKEIAQTQTKINKIQKEKMIQLNLILLFIQIKEKIIKIPEMAYKYFGTSDKNLEAEKAEKQKILLLNRRRSSVKKQALLNKFNENIVFNEDMQKIMKYKGKIIYNDISEFEYDFNHLQEKIRMTIEYLQISEKNKKELKRNLELIKLDNIENEKVGDKLNRLNYILRNLKNKNAELNTELKSLKIKYSNNSNSNNDSYNNSKNTIYNKTSKIRKSSSTGNILQNLSSIQNNRIVTEKNFFNTIFSNSFNTIYNPKKIMHFKKYFTIEKFDFNKASNLFLSCYNLYNITKENYFSEKDIQFDIDIKRGSTLEPEKITILKMLEYIDKIVTLLINQKKMYLKNKYLKKKYKKIKDLLDKDKRRMNFIIGFKSDEEKRKMKLRQMSLRKEKERYLQHHKVEYKYFFKNQKEQIAQAINLAQLKRAPTFDDFMFDVIGK